MPPQEGSLYASTSPLGGAVLTTEVANHSSMGVDKTSEWCNSFVPVLKAHGKVVVP